jgi:hypothetical protein
MGRDRKPQERSRRWSAYVADERVSDAEKGTILLALLGHALIYLLLSATHAIWLVVTALRVWRRREAGWTSAVKDGVHKPTLAALVAATLTYEIARRLGVAALDRRTSAGTSRVTWRS